jgi:polygalacturonase
MKPDFKPVRLFASMAPALVLCLFFTVEMAGAAPARLSVRDFGAKGDGTAKDTEAFRKAIESAGSQGGAEVLIPAGTYLIGSISLPSHVTLRLEKGSLIQGSDDLADYPLETARWEGVMRPAYRALIHADHADAISIVGEGAIHGGATIGKGRAPRGAVLIEPVGCSNVRLEGITLENHNVWTFHPVFCKDVTVSHVTFNTDGHNSDGIDPDSVQGMKISSCVFSTGDDCIAIKSGKGIEGRKMGRPTTDVLVRDCRFIKGHAGVAIGSEVSGGIRGVRIERCSAEQTDRLLRIKTCPGRGALIEDIIAEDLETTTPVLVLETNYGSNPDSQGIPGPEGITRIRNIRVARVKADASAKTLVEVDGSAEMPVDGLVLSEISGTSKKGIVLQNVKRVVLEKISVTASTGPLLATQNAEGQGLEAAVPWIAPAKKPRK